MSKSIPKPISIKLLEAKKIPFAQYNYPKTLKDAELVAQSVGFPPNQVFKTLVVQPPDSSPKSKWTLCLIPANSKLNLKKLATVSGVKKLKLATHQEAEAVTGLQVGGISALALLNKGFVVVLDRAANDFDQIVMSAGVRGIQVKLPVKAFIKLTKAKLADVSNPNEP